MALKLNLRISARAHAQLPYIQTCASHMEEITGKFLYVYIEVALRYKPIRVDERGLSSPVPELSFLPAPYMG